HIHTCIYTHSHSGVLTHTQVYSLTRVRARVRAVMAACLEHTHPHTHRHPSPARTHVYSLSHTQLYSNMHRQLPSCHSTYGLESSEGPIKAFSVMKGGGGAESDISLT